MPEVTDTQESSLITDHAFNALEPWHLCDTCNLGKAAHRGVTVGRIQELEPNITTDIGVPRATILEEATKIVEGARGRAYGHPADDFARTAGLWSAILGTKVTARQVALCMILVKVSRETNRHGRDNLVDIAGYARTLEMVIDREESGKEYPVEE